MQSPKIVQDAGPTSRILWTRLAKLFTIVSLENPEYESNRMVNESLEKVGNEFERYHLLEDVDLTGLPNIARLIENNTEFKNVKLNDIEEVSKRFNYLNCSSYRIELF